MYIFTTVNTETSLSKESLIWLFLNLLLGARVFLTVALDVVISGISQPVRFLIEAKARIIEVNKSNDISSQDISDTIWSSFKKVTPFTEEFDMTVKQVNRIYIYIFWSMRRCFV
jgi:hypothetical protein